MREENKAAPGGHPVAAEGTTRGSDSTRRPVKWKRVLQALYDGRTLNRFEAERLHDHCLHSTVSTIQAKGVTILRRLERVPGFMGQPTDCCRYWIAPEARQKAAELLGVTQ